MADYKNMHLQKINRECSIHSDRSFHSGPQWNLINGNEKNNMINSRVTTHMLMKSDNAVVGVVPYTMPCLLSRVIIATWGVWCSTLETQRQQP
jgi:hypothetical protein